MLLPVVDLAVTAVVAGMGCWLLLAMSITLKTGPRRLWSRLLLQLLLLCDCQADQLHGTLMARGMSNVRSFCLGDILLLGCRDAH